MRRCDVIIPIYNAYDCVRACVDSVLENTDFKVAHLILIDDKSPDERIIPLLDGYAKDNPDKVTVLKNEKNLGFVGTVNKGMRFSKSDVLLLNSDTEVPVGWLDRIIKCAYSDEMIATVTPLSNNATLASVPKIFTRNELPDGYSLQKMDDLVRKYSLKDYPEIPTAHGFCMFIKRSALEIAGYFDEENFGKGYGEENDFSFRCFKYGLRNVLCDDAYVLHKESQSFLDKKIDNSVALAKKHPELKNNLDYWCNMRDIRRVSDNVALAMGVREDRPNVLFLIHDFSDFENNVGGTTLHVMDIIRNLRKKYNFHVLAPEGHTYKVYSFFQNSWVNSAVYGRPILIESIGLRSSDYGRMLASVINDFKISFVHIHHMLGHFFNVIDVCDEKQIKYAVSLHDMYLKTPIVSMLDSRVKNDTQYPIELSVWRNECEHLLDGAVEVIAPSEFAKKEYNEVYKHVKIRVVSHGVDIAKVEAKDNVGEEKNIAFVGAIFPHKGSGLLERLSGCIKKNDGLNIHLFGTTTAKIKKNNFFVDHGPYKRAELGDLMKENKINLVCAFSLAPETFAYTVEEAVAAGVPVLTFDIGAAAERVKDNEIGWVIEYTEDEKKIYSRIKSIFEDRVEYRKKIDGINVYKIVNTKDMALKYGKIYEKFAVPCELNFRVLQKRLLEADFAVNLVTQSAGGNYADDYFAIVNSRKWRMVSKIRVPDELKRVIKKVIRG